KSAPEDAHGNRSRGSGPVVPGARARRAWSAAGTRGYWAGGTRDRGPPRGVAGSGRGPAGAPRAALRPGEIRPGETAICGLGEPWDPGRENLKYISRGPRSQAGGK